MSDGSSRGKAMRRARPQAPRSPAGDGRTAPARAPQAAPCPCARTSDAAAELPVRAPGRRLPTGLY